MVFLYLDPLTDRRQPLSQADLLREWVYVDGLTGVRNFVAGEQSITGTFYTNSKTYLQNTVNAQGKTFESLLGDENLVIPDDNVPISANHDRIGLVASVGYKLYAKGIWKVHFTCRVSPGGWHKYVYERVPTT